jgi:acylphosphatase
MKSEDLHAKRYLISGRVQGVGFRWFTRTAAEQIGVVGTVRNLHDGRVEAIGVGSDDQLRQFKESISKGPSFSHVMDIREDELSEIPRCTHFDITY